MLVMLSSSSCVKLSEKLKKIKRFLLFFAKKLLQSILRIRGHFSLISNHMSVMLFMATWFFSLGSHDMDTLLTSSFSSNCRKRQLEIACCSPRLKVLLSTSLARTTAAAQIKKESLCSSAISLDGVYKCSRMDSCQYTRRFYKRVFDSQISRQRQCQKA